jgi:imidazolonepropionase-like amidohydrolase
MRAIRASWLFDGVSSSLVKRPLLIIESGKIVSIESDGVTPSGVELVDLGPSTILPGLIDSHMHLAFRASANPLERLDGATDDLVAAMRAAALRSLNAGITTLRDLGDKGYLAVRVRQEFSADPGSGPTILAAGPPLTPTRGHCWFLGGEADGVAGVRAAVREHARQGVDVIKIMASGGDITPGTSPAEAQYSMAELRAAVKEAHKLGLPVSAHAHALKAIENALSAGVDTIEHCTFLTPRGIDAPDRIIRALADAGATVSATLGKAPGVPALPAHAARQAAAMAALSRVREAGVGIICSTDAGVSAAKPHDVLPHAVAEFVEHGGASPLEALRSVTSGAAVACRVADTKGRIAAGYDADILAVDGDPISDVAALQNVVGVFRSGRRIR